MPTFEVKLTQKRGGGQTEDFFYIIDIDNAVLAVQKIDEETHEPASICINAEAKAYDGKIYRKNIIS